MMKKLVAILLLICSVGCIGKGKNDEISKQTAYEGYYQTLESVNRFQDESDFYSMSADMVQLPDGTYRYYIFLDKPQIAMYDVVLLAVENGVSFDMENRMMPSMGIFDKEDINMIPFQANPQSGYAKGLVISGTCDTSEITVKLLVEWKDMLRENTMRQFHLINISFDGNQTSATTGEEGNLS